MTVILLLNSSKFTYEISIPSISIDPSYNSRILSKVRIIVDFPAPVLPTTPIFSLGLILTLKFLRTGGRFSLYLADTSL